MFVRDIFSTILLTLTSIQQLNSSPCQTYGCSKNLFLPAPPGRTPNCAQHGETYCEQIEHYPTQVIQYLIEHWQFDYNSLFIDEKRENKPRPLYGPPVASSFPYPPKSKFPSHYGGVHQHLQPPPPYEYNGIFHRKFNQSEGGYGERNYPVPPPSLQVVNTDPSILYSALFRQDLSTPPVTPYDPNKWWRRYARIARRKRDILEEGDEEEGHLRMKRQASTTTTLCPTTPRFIMPRAALNNQGNWMYVVNLDNDQRFTQLVRSEMCISSQCNGICSLPNGYSSKCEQQFVQKRLIALDGGGDNLYTDLFWLPHCCICQISQSNL